MTDQIFGELDDRASTPDPDAPPCAECGGGLAHYPECSVVARRGLADLGADAAAVEREINQSLDRLQPGGRYDVDRENDLRRAVREASAADVEALEEIIDYAQGHLTVRAETLMARLTVELRVRIDEIGSDVMSQIGTLS